MADADQNKPYIQEGEAIWTQIKDIEHRIQQAESELAQTKAEIEVKQQHLQQKHHELETGQQKLDNLKQQFRELLQCQTPQPLTDELGDSPDTVDQISRELSEPSVSQPSNGHSANHHPDQHQPKNQHADQPIDSANDVDQPRGGSFSDAASSQANGHAAPTDPVQLDEANNDDWADLDNHSQTGATYHLTGDEISSPSEQVNPEAAEPDQELTGRAYREPHDEIANSRPNQSLELDHAAIWSVLEHMIGSILAIAALLLGVLGIVLVLDGSRKALLLVASGVLIGIASGLLLSPSLPIQWPSLWTQIQTIRDRTRPSQPQRSKSPKPKRRGKPR